MQEPINGAISGAAMTSPLWLHQLSDVAAMILPILGAVWLGVQIYYKITAGRNGR